MDNRFQRLYEPLKDALSRCDAFAGVGTLHAVFSDARISEWWPRLPQTQSRERRIVQTISFLHRQYNVGQENALALLLRVLSERTDPGSAFSWELAEMAGAVERAIKADSLRVFNEAVAGTELGLEDAPVPFAGQVIAGTGDVVMTYIDELVPGEMYRLDVVGTSMEHEDIFEGDHVLMRAFYSFEWPGDGELIVTKYLPFDVEPEIPTDLPESELLGPTLKVFHQNADGEFQLGWRKDNASWKTAPWRGLTVPGNHQMIATRYLRPIGKVVDVKRQRWWDFSPSAGIIILGDNR